MIRKNRNLCQEPCRKSRLPLFPALVFFLLATLLICLLWGCSSGSSPDESPPGESAQAEDTPAYGDLMVEGSIGDASNLISILSSDSASHGISRLVFDGLVKYDKNITLVGAMARSWDISEDGLVITFHLRDDVTWHDGEPFTAHDVLYTYEVTIDPKTPTAYAGDFLRVSRAEVIDDHTFRVTYDEPFAPALGSWGASILPRHLLEGEDITRSPLARHPIGTGPFRFKEWATGQKIVLEANPDYYDGRPRIDGYIMRIIPDMATMFLELRAQGVDMMNLTPMQYTRQTEAPIFQRNYNKYRYPAFGYTYLGYNLNNPMFQDRRVRQALSYAIDTEEIIRGILLGLGQEATGPLVPSSWAYNPDVRRYPHDPDKALALLAEAGWKDTTGDGFLDRDGRRFSFEIITNQGNEVRARCAEIIQRRLADIGIDVRIRIIEWAAFINDFINKKRFDATILGWSIGMDPDMYDIWHSSKTRPGELNFISFAHDEVDELLEQGRSTFDREERKAAYHRIQEIMAEEQPYTFLFVPDALPIIHTRFRGIEPAPIGIRHNFIEWYVPKSEQRYVLTP